MSQSRQLAAIMFTDIVGYTTLMGKDEQKAFEILKKNRQIQRPLIERHNGKWLKEMGDGILVSFATVTDAVYCALEIQNRLKKEAGFLLRIGIHLGEVVFEKGDVFGDGVNIASRIQSIAPAGEIVVSESVCRNITNQKGLQVIFLSEETLKNVDAPIKIYRVKLESNTEAEADQFLRHTTNNNNDAFRGKRKLIGVLLVIAILLTAAIFLYSRISNNKKLSSEKLIPQAEKKSIAVLPFIDMSADKDQEYLGDGIAEEILNVLNNMMQDLKVTGRTSSFSFKGKGTDLKTIGKILNVKSILEGSVKKFGDKVRVTVNLINAEDESTIWSDQYDRQLKDIFSIQDEIAVKVGEKLKLTLFKDNVSSESRTVNPAAYEMVLKGNFYFNKGPEGIAEAVEFHKKAIAIDSTYAYPHIRLGWAIYQLTLYGVYPSKTGFAMARKEIEKGFSLQITAAEKHSAHVYLAYTNLWQYNWKDAWSEYEKALDINPKRNDFQAFYQSLALGKTADAVKTFNKVIEENPVDVLNLRDLAMIQYLDRQYAAALQTCDKILDLNLSFSEAYRIKGSVFFAEKKIDLALANFKKAEELKNPWAPIQIITALANTGQKENARKLFSTVDNTNSNYVPAFAKALIYYSLDDANKAFEWLNRSYDEKDFWLASLKVDPLWDPLRNDSRFKTLVKKMNFPE